MAFGTELVMGAGGSVEEIPVSMSGSGNGTYYPLIIINAGSGSLVALTGSMSPGSTSSTNRPHLMVGPKTYITPHAVFDGADAGFVAHHSGIVSISVLSRSASTTSFNGLVRVIRI